MDIRKKTALILSMAMVCSLAGCSEKNTPAQPPATDITTEQTTSASASETAAAPASDIKLDSKLLGHYDGAIIMDEDGNMIDTDEEWLEIYEDGKAKLFLQEEADDLKYDVYTEEDILFTTDDGYEIMGQFEDNWVYLSIEGLVLMLVKEGSPDWEEHRKPAGSAASSETQSETSADTTELSAPEADYDMIYSPVISEISHVINKGYDMDKEYTYLPSGITERVMYGETSELQRSIGYLIKDISGDGIPELLLGETAQDDTKEYNDKIVYGCYTYSDGAIVPTFEGMTRSAHKATGEGTFCYCGSGGAAVTLIGKCHISKDGTKLEWDDFYFTDGEPGGDISYYYNTNGIFGTEESEKRDMTPEEFSALMDSFDSEAVQLPFIPIGGAPGGPEENVDLDKIALEGGLGEEECIIDLPDGEMEGTWHDPALGTTITLYEYRGEFEAKSSTGGTISGETIYNGDPEAPVYTLRDYDGNDFAQIYFFKTTNGYRCMSVTYSDDKDHTAVYLK